MPHPMHSEAAIRVSGVHKHFGSVRAVQGVDLVIQTGEVFGLIGHNGAGKSTLFKMMLGLIAPTKGQILIRGVPVMGAQFREVRKSVGYLPENVALYDHLTGLEILSFFAKLKGVDPQTCGHVLEQVGLNHAADRAVQTYSKGMRQRLGFAQALLGQPQVLFLDEPTTGLDPQAIREFYQTLRALRQQGVTMILTSHILAELQDRVDRVAVMASGQIQALGSLHDLREQADMPLTIQVRCAPGALQSILDALSNDAMDLHPRAAAESWLHLRCHRAQKLPVLSKLTLMGQHIQDIRVIEPTLEDLFFKEGA